MGFKKITIVLVPDGTNRVKQFRLPNLLLPILVLFLFSCGAFVAWIGLDYQTIKAQMPRIAHLQKENEQQRMQYLYLTERIGQMKQKMEELKEIDTKLKALAKLETGEGNDSFLGVGGSGPRFQQSDFFVAKTHRGLVRQMHRSLDDLNDEIIARKKHKTDLHKLLENQKTHLTSTTSIGPTKGGMGLSFGYRTSLFPLERVDKGKKNLAKGKKEKIREQLKAIAIELGLDPSLALGMAKVESGYDPKRVSPKGAVGVLQVMPRLAKHSFGISRKMLFYPEINIRIGLSWMKSLLKRFDHNLDLSLAAYNAGASRVVRAGYKIPRIKETQAYVRKVKAAMKDGT